MKKLILLAAGALVAGSVLADNIDSTGTVKTDSPAAVTGLQKGDTIVGFKGQPIATVDDLHKNLVASEIGVPSPLMFLRGTEKLFRMVVPWELPPAKPLRGEKLN